MLKRGHYFSGQVRDEKVIAFVKQHPMAIFASTIFSITLFLLCIVFVIYVIYTPNDLVSRIITQDMGTVKQIKLWTISIIGCGMLFIVAYYIKAWICYYFNVMILTQEHLVDVRQERYFNRKISEQSLLRVQDVSSKMSGIWQTYFRYGTVYVETAGEAPNFIMPNIPHPYKMSNLIMELHEKLVQQGNYQESMAEGEGLMKSKPNSAENAENRKIIIEKKPEMPKTKSASDSNKNDYGPEISHDKHQEYLTLKDQIIDTDQLEGQANPRYEPIKMKDKLTDIRKAAKDTPSEIVEKYGDITSDETKEGVEENFKKNQTKASDANTDSGEGELQDGDSVKFE